MFEVATPSNISVVVNGESHAIPGGSTVAALLETLSLTGRKVAVERNGEIVPRSAFSRTVLAEADRLEIVVAVGGG